MDKKSLLEKVQEILAALRLVPAIVMLTILSVALTVLGSGLIFALIIVIRSIPDHVHEIQALTLPFIIGGVIIIVLVILAFLVRTARGAGDAIPDESYNVLPSRVRVSPGTSERQLPPGNVVEGSTAYAPARTTDRTAPTKKQSILAGSAIVISGIVGGAICEIIIIAIMGASGTLQIAAGIISGLAAAAIAYLLYSNLWRSRAAR